MRLVVLLLLAGASLCTADVDYDVNIWQHLQEFSSQRFANSKYQETHDKAKDYILETFKFHGLDTVVQEFNTSINTNVYDIDPIDEVVIGRNIIGIAEAKSDKAEAVIVVGADYDTNGIDNPLFNNGAGMAVLLETARLFAYNVKWSQNFSQAFTTIFVAFDLNTKEHQGSGGKAGGWYFVHEWLWSYLNRSDVNFGGAYIIDSVMNVNLDVQSQSVNDQFRQMFPDPYKNIKESNFKGNFLSMVTLNMEKSLKLKDQYSGNYNKDRLSRPYRLEDMTLPKSLPTNKLLASFTHQESIHFWTFTDPTKNDSIPLPLPAVLLTDTEELRRIPMMEGCDKGCPGRMIFTDERKQFLESTTIGLLRTLLARQAKPFVGAGNMVTTIPSLIISMVMMLMAFKYQ